MCNWFQNKSPTHTFAVDWDTWHGNWAAPCYFNGALPTGSARWDNCLQRHLACEGLYRVQSTSRARWTEIQDSYHECEFTWDPCTHYLTSGWRSGLAGNEMKQWWFYSAMRSRYIALIFLWRFHERHPKAYQRGRDMGYRSWVKSGRSCMTHDCNCCSVCITVL